MRTVCGAVDESTYSLPPALSDQTYQAGVESSHANSAMTSITSDIVREGGFVAVPIYSASQWGSVKLLQRDLCGHLQ